MSLGEHETTDAATRTNRVGRPEPGVPLFTWIIGATALLVVVAAGALFLEPPAHQKIHNGPTTSAMEEITVLADPEPTAIVAGPAPNNPLELTASFLDAQERAKLWSQRAILSGIELVIENGKPRGPITFEFGEAHGQKVPGSPLSSQRYSLSYENKEVKEESMDSPTPRVGLPEPNCPLEVAFRTFAQGGASASGRIAVLYTHSRKHGKPVWLVTDAEGHATSLNADSCALLRR